MLVKSKEGSYSQLNVFLLKLVGLVSFEARSLNFLGTVILSICTHCGLVIATTMFFSNLMRKIYGNEQYFVHIAETVGICGVHTRFLIMFTNRKMIASIMKQSDKLWDQVEANEFPVIRSFVEKNLTLTHFYLAANLATIVFYVSTSQIPAPHTANSSVTKSLPYAYYIEPPATPWYELSISVQLFAMTVICFTCSGVDTAASFFVMIVCGYLRLLCDRLQNLIRMVDGSQCQSDEVDVLNKMISCIVYHQNIIRLYEEVEKLTKLLYFVQVISTTYNISLLGLKIVSDDPEKSKYFTLIAVLVCQLFLCQWAPDHLISESEFLARNIYFVPPTNNDSKTLTKMINILLIRAQRSLQLTAGGLVNLSIECFGSMVTSALSFFTILRNLN